MKTHPLLLILPAACLLISCDEKEPASSSPNGETKAHAQAKTSSPDKPVTLPTPEPNPKINVAKLNKDLARALMLNQTSQALAAIEAGADPNAINRYGLPVLFSAAQAGDAAIVKALITKGADPNTKIGTSYNTAGVGYTGTTDGTPLGYAAAKGKLQAMEALVTAGADVNGAGPEGRTPLIQAVDSGKFAVVEWLIAKGANASDGKALREITMIINPDPERQKIIELLKKQNQ